MATIAARPNQVPGSQVNLPGRKYDHWFFSSAAILMLLTVFVGFAPTYFLAGMFRAPLPSPIIHVHGALFSLWILLLVTQTSLVAAGRVDIHRRLGIAGFILACVMVAAGVLAATDSLVHGRSPSGVDPRSFYIVPMSNMLVFATMIFFAFRARKNPASHKRFIFLATTALLVAALARWPIAYIHRQPLHAMFVSWLFIAALLIYDLWSTRKPHRVTLFAGLLLVAADVACFPISQTAPWLAFADWVRHLAH